METDILSEEWIEYWASLVTDTIITRHKLDKTNKRTCAIAVWNLAHPDNQLTETSSTEDYLNDLVLLLHTKFGDQVLFKGGFILMKLFPNKARLSQDIDFSISNISLYSNIMSVIEEYVKHLQTSGNIKEYVIKDNITPTSSGGIKVYANDGSVLFGVDVGLHDITYGYHKVNILHTGINVFQYERMLSDKISATLSRKRFRRPKDLYDIYLITSNVNLDLSLIRSYLDKRSEATDWNNYPFTDVIIREYKKAYDSLTLVSHDKHPIQNPPDFNIAFDRYNKLVYALLHTDYTQWNYKEGVFK